ncbi:hypothetical protein VP01_11585g1, partial [Puccinia sorghi]
TITNSKLVPPLRNKVAKIYIKWHIQNLNLLEFKSSVFGAIHIQDAPELGDNAEELDKNGMITWEVSVPHEGPFAAKNKATRYNNWVFADFIEVISKPGEDGQKVIITLIEKDPNAAAQVSLISFCFSFNLHAI